MATSSDPLKEQGKPECSYRSVDLSLNQDCLVLFNRIKVTFKDAKGENVTEVEGNEGDDLLSLAHEWDVDLEGQSFYLTWIDPVHTDDLIF